MIRNQKFVKAFAVFFIIELLSSVILPSFSWALTAGPTAPEVTSFEPVDTSDVVNLQTGDLVYNIPLLEVPGPAGNYPINLSYHSNIQTNQEGSWTGLGWSINPGAINRFVNGYPDDHSGITNVSRDFWEGGQTEVYTVGLSVGIAYGPSVTSSLSFAHDTYRGSSIGASAEIGYSVGSTGLSGGNSPNGQSNPTSDFNSSPSASDNSQVGISAGMTLGISSSGVSVMGASIAMNSSKYRTNMSVGASGVHNEKKGKLSSRSNNFKAEMPIAPLVNLRFARSYQRYWIDETVNVETYGSLYAGGLSPGYSRAFDTYDLLDPDVNLAYQANPESVLGGSFPDVDFYSVTAQGVGGTIRPYAFRANLYRQDKKQFDSNNLEEIVSRSYPLGQQLPSSQLHFRFTNEFSNRYEYAPPPIDNSNGQLSFEFTGTPLTGESGSDGYVDNNLIASRSVQWFTNMDIIEQTSRNPFNEGFINCEAGGFVRDNNLQIGGYTITNVSGVKFHYALPVYSYDEILKSQNTEKQQETNGLYFNQLTKPEKYAYTWLLTAVTGPDYVDRNGNGLDDSGDWGYWVRFDYSKLYSDYKWRNPGEGFNKDIDNFDFFSFGKKELYYLDKIVTETHVAVFDKSLRNDSREVDNISGGFSPTTQVIDPQCASHCQTICEEQYCPSGNCSEPERTDCIETCTEGCYSWVFPRPTLKLDRIRLFNYKDYQNNQLDKSIRSIDFTYDYSLAPGTPNSYDETNNYSQLLGKLTLTGVSFLGKENQSLIPPITFQYKNAPYEKDHYDAWGFYKSDYTDTGNANLDRLTSEASAEGVDAWSLQTIRTSMGAEINIQYESDRYRKPALYKKEILTVSKISPNSASQTIDIEFFNPPANLPTYTALFNAAELSFLFRRVFQANDLCYCDGGYATLPGSAMGNFYDTKDIVLSANDIVSVDDNSIEITNATLYEYLVNSQAQTYYTESTCYDEVPREIDPEISILNPVFVAGNLFHNASQEVPGGGTRVSKITVNNINHFQETIYEYVNGTTTYEPFQLGRIRFDFGLWEQTTWSAELSRIREAKASYYEMVMGNVSNLLSVSRILPGPGVNYEFVSVKQQRGSANSEVVPFPSYTRYQFEVFNEGMIGFENSTVVTTETPGQYDDTDYAKVNSKNTVLKDYTSRIGSLKKISVLSSDGQLLSETTNNYLHDDMSGSFSDNKSLYEQSLSDKFKNQGVTEETYSRGRIVLYKSKTKKPYEEGYFSDDERHLLGVVSKLEMFPAIKIGEVNKNYKTGLITTTVNESFDFYSGEVTNQSYTDEFNNSYLTEVIPAYRKYPAMESVVLGGKNMLSQVAGISTFKIDLSPQTHPKTGIVYSSAQKWSDQIPSIQPGQSETIQTGIWRKHSTYSYIEDNSTQMTGDGLIPVVNDAPPRFDGWDVADVIPEGWQKENEINLYDIYSHALQAEDINKNHVTTKMSADQTLVLSTAGNSEYSEFAYSGAEDITSDNIFGGGVLPGDGLVDPLSHTGSQSIKLNSGGTGFNVALITSSSRQMYHVSLWVFETNASDAQFYYQFKDALTGIPIEPTPTYAPINISTAKKSGQWYQFNVDVAVPQSSAELKEYTLVAGVRNNGAAPIYVDDFRIHPYDASMVSYVYNKWGELTHILDNNNLYTEYRYDGMGRLKESFKETFNHGSTKTGEIKYHYAVHE